MKKLLIMLIVLISISGIVHSQTYEPDAKSIKIDEFSDQTFNITSPVTGLNVSWYVDGQFVTNESSYTYSGDGSVGTHTIEVNTTDGENTSRKVWTLTTSNRPIASSFDGATTNFLSLSDLELSNKSSVVLEKTMKGKIDFGNNRLNLSDTVDIDSYVAVESTIVAIDTAKLPALNASAAITMYDLPFTSTPAVYYNTGFTTNAGEISTVCPSNICSNINYDRDTGILTFNVAHFSSFLAEGDTSGLRISDLKARVDGRKDNGADENGGKIDKDVSPGSVVTLEITIENILDMSIEDIEIEGTIRDIDDGNDIDDTYELDKIKGDDEEDVELSFRIPLEAEEDDYDLDITIEGEDDDGNAHKVTLELKVEVEKEKHALVIDDAYLSPGTLGCSRSTMLNLNIINVGDNEEEGTIEVKNEYLGIQFSEGFYVDNEDDATKVFNIDIGSEVPAGIYTIDIEVDFRDDVLYDTVELEVRNCQQAIVQEPALSIQKVGPTVTQSTAVAQTTSVTSRSSDDTMIIVVYGITTLILLALVVLMAFYVAVKVVKKR